MAQLKAYEQLGLTGDDVLEIQRWMFPMIAEQDLISKMIPLVVNKFSGTKQHYALYLLGAELGQAKAKEELGIAHLLDTENI